MTVPIRATVKCQSLLEVFGIALKSRDFLASLDDHHQVHRGREVVPAQSESFPEDTLAAVSNHRTAHLSGHDHSQARNPDSRRGEVDQEVSGCDPPASPLDPAEISGRHDARFPRKTEVARRGHYL